MSNRFMKSSALLAAFSAICSVSNLLADEDQLAKNSLWKSSKNTAAAQECTPAPACPCIPPYQGEALCSSMLPFGYSAPARLELACAWDVSVFASFIYWQPRQDEFYLATRSFNTHTGAMPRDVAFIDFDYKYRPGFKAGLATALPIDSWILSGEYTWLHGHEHSHATAAAPQHLEPWFAAGYNSGNARSVTNKWSYQFDLVDLSLSRPFYSGTNLLLTPYVGGRLFLNRQKVHGTNVFDTDIGPAENLFTIPLKVKANGWELGPRVGLNGNWLAGEGFGVLGELGFSMLYASFKAKHIEQGTITIPSTATGVQIVKNVNFFAPNMDLSVGVRWGSYVNDQKQHIDFALKYDFLYFWKGAYISAMSLSQGLGDFDLYLQGLTASAKLDF